MQATPGPNNLARRRSSDADLDVVRLMPPPPPLPPPDYEQACLFLTLGPKDFSGVPDSARYFYSYVCRAPDGFTLATVGPLSGLFVRLRCRAGERRYRQCTRLAKKFMIGRCGRLLFQQAGREGPPPSPLDSLADACPAFGAALRDVLEAAGRRAAANRGGDTRRLHSVYLVDGDRLRARLIDRLGLPALT